jgi:hypothetical protein
MKHSFLHLGAFCFEKGRPRATVPQINLNFCSVLKIQVNKSKVITQKRLSIQNSQP